MGWEDLLKSVMDVATDEKAQQAMSGGGLVGLAAYNKMKQKQDELSQRPKPGPDCLPTCVVDDERCTECVREQKAARVLLDRLKQVEDAIENPEYLEELQTDKPEKCKLCSAPYEVGAEECPYCGTKYDVVWTGSFDNIPRGKGEQKRYMLQLAEEAYAAYLVYFNRCSSYAAESNPFGLPSALMGLASKFSKISEEKMAMTGQDIAEMAKHYEMSCSEYLEGIKTGATVSKGVYKLQELNKKMEKERLEREAASRERQAANMERMQAERERKNENFKRQLDMIYSSGPAKYSAGPSTGGRCCGTCMHYIVGATSCVIDQHSPSASHSCSLYKMK